jgi:hypothetical protein
MENPRNGHLIDDYDDPGSALSADSTESRWVFEEDENLSEIEDYDASDMRHQSMFDSEEEDNVDQKLIRTGPRVDSFDVEALEVPGAHTHHYEVIVIFFFSSSFNAFFLFSLIRVNHGLLMD